MNRMIAGVLIGVAVLAGAPMLARSTQVEYRTPRELGDQSKLVVRGEVVEVRSYWNEKRTKIFTSARVNVAETYKGSGPGSVEVVQLGGVVDNVRVTVQGALAWRTGEEVVLFLEPYEGAPSGAPAYQVSGFSQGKFDVVRDSRSGKAYINRPEMKETDLAGAPSAGNLQLSSKIENVPIEQFINEALGRR